MKRELTRQPAIEPMIGCAKRDGGLGGNFPLSQDGDVINALLAAAGHNPRLAPLFVALRLALTLRSVVGEPANADASRSDPNPQSSTA